MAYIPKNEVIDWLRKNLDKERFEHSIGAAETAAALAEKYGLDEEKAYYAGLLHDCAKCMPKEEQLLIIKNDLCVQECEADNPKIYHAPVGAYLAEEKFNVEDEEILSAIRWHTLGRVNMTNFEKIIFLADKIEPKTRVGEHINLIKSKLNGSNGLNAALLECYKSTIKSLVERNLVICPNTIDIYNELTIHYGRN